MLTRVKFLFIGMRQTLDVVLTFFCHLLLLCTAIDNAVLLLLHPLDVRDLFLLNFEVIPSMPVVFSLLIFGLEQVVEVLRKRVNVLRYLVSFALDILLVFLNGLYVLSEFLQFFVLDVELCLVAIELCQKPFFLSVQFVLLRLERRELFCLGKRGLQQFDFFDELGFLACGLVRSGLLLVLKFVDRVLNLLKARVLFRHLLQQVPFFFLDGLNLPIDVSHLLENLSLLGSRLFVLANFCVHSLFIGKLAATHLATLLNLILLLSQLTSLLSDVVDLFVELRHFSLEVFFCWLLQTRFFSRQGWDLGGLREHHLWVNLRLAIVELVLP